MRSDQPTNPSIFQDVVLTAPTIRCGSCVAKIERSLSGIPGVARVRANLTLRRINVTLAQADGALQNVLAELENIGHPSRLIDSADLSAEAKDDTEVALLKAVAVSGFGAMNVMLLSVAVWSGASDATRDSFHLISGIIALPIVLYAARFFFVSAWGALRRASMNMDVPIALAIALALALSLFETLRGGEDVFFDAAVTLTFFLLIGRYLDYRMRGKARSAMTGLQRLAVREAWEVTPEGKLRTVAADAIRPGMVLRIPAGERIPVDLRITSGASDLDRSLLTGESAPVAVATGDEVEAGALNLTGPVDAMALRPVEDSFLAMSMRMLAGAEESRSTYVRIADRAAQLYAPVIHLVAFATFVGWLLATGDWHRAAFVAISVLIVTCPCALALAVPVAHVVASSRLMAEGVLIKEGSALERLATATRAIWDKTGTLTDGSPVLAEGLGTAPGSHAAATLAAHSAHPVARCISAACPAPALPVQEIREHPGYGVEGLINGRRARLGRPSWVADIAGEMTQGDGPAFAFAGEQIQRFPLRETLREGAAEAVVALRDAGLPSEILSGDAPAAVARVAAQLEIQDTQAGLTPQDKVTRLQDLLAQGERPLMVGDGLNDTAALAAAHVSMSPASATEAGRAAADFVFLREGLDAVPLALSVARRTAAIVRQNFGLAIAYNCIAVPLAIAGHVTPLFAAIAMSGSSIAVVANSLRLNRRSAARPALQLQEAPA
ncbi:heavy metal translocating P-type ATPase [Sulfitobacter sp. SH24]|jgi:Cu2+-exporting ATPase|uniref:heavy metal translocating P-type ATPase n=1 Tax=Sulfitobacter sp. SH24 TaxID=3421173 RepID=UPI003F4F6383